MPPRSKRGHRADGVGPQLSCRITGATSCSPNPVNIVQRPGKEVSSAPAPAELESLSPWLLLRDSFFACRSLSSLACLALLVFPDLCSPLEAVGGGGDSCGAG